MTHRAHTKLVIIVTVALVAGLFFWLLLQRYILQPQAAVSTVSITMNPKSGPILIGDEGVMNMVVSSTGDGGISGLDISLKGEGLTILDMTKPEVLEATEEIVFTELISEVNESGATARNASVLIAEDAKLPKTVHMQVTYRGDKPGVCSISVDKNVSQIVGNVTGSAYSIGSSDQAVFDCQGAVPTGPRVDVLFSPKSVAGGSGSALTSTLMMQPKEAGQGISGFDFSMRFDQDVVSVSAVTEPADTGVRAGGSPSPTSGASPTSEPVITIPVGPTVTPAVQACTKVGDCHAKCEVINTATGQVICPDVRCVGNQCLINPAGTSCTQDIDCQQPCSGLENDNLCEITNRCIEGTCQYPNSLAETIAEQAAKNNFTKLKKNIDNTAGTIELAYVVIDTDENLPTQPTMDVVLTCKRRGSGTLSISKAQIVGNVEGSTYSASLSALQYSCDGAGMTPTITRAPDGGPTPDPSAGRVRLNLKLKFQGVTSKPPDEYNRLMVACELGDGALGGNNVKSTGAFTADASGVWSGTVGFDVEPGIGYKVLCKGPKHLKKKICDASPSETYPGTYACDKGTITLTEGANALDFSGIVQLVGDLPDRAHGGRQDGVVNSYDIGFIRNSFDKSDAESLSIGDLNLDGKINAIDHALVIAALETRADEQ